MSPQPLAFDDLVVDFAGRRLLRGGVEQPLEPKAFDVLALLAHAPGQAFTRDQILDAVWGHRHVTPAVLNRIMSLLRHALGEDAQHARYLHTLYGVGYRFNLPAEAPAAGAVHDMQVAVPRVAIADAVESPAAIRPPTVEYEHRASDSAPRPLRRLRPLLWTLPLLAILALIGWRVWPREAATPAAGTRAPRAHAKPTLVVLPLKAIGDEEGARVIADGLSEELIGSLARIDGLRVIARTSTRLAAAETDDPSRLVQRLGITHALEGSLQQAGQSLRIHLRLVDARGGALWVRDFDRDASEVLLMQREISDSVATSLTLKLGLPTAPGKSGNAEFLRRFLATKKMLSNELIPAQQRLEPAEAEFRALLRERPDDARVHAALAMVLNYRAFSNQKLPTAVQDDALQEAITAQRLDPSLAEPYFVRAFVACQRNEWEPCVALMQEADKRGMRTPPLANPAMALVRLGYLDRAEALARELVARDPLNEASHFTLGRVLDTMGRHDEAHAEFLPSRRHLDALNHYAHWFNAYWRKDHAEASRLVEEGLASNDSNWPKLRPTYLATMRALSAQGTWPEAEAEYRRFEQDTGLFALLRVILPDAPAHAPELIAGLERMRKGSYSTWDLVLWNKDYAFLRRDPAFQDYLRRNGILAYWKRHGFPQQCRPQGDGAVCD